MSARASRLSGGAITVTGGALVAYFLAQVVASSDPVYWVLLSLPIGISGAVAGMGLLLARGRLVAEGFVGRLLAWTAAGFVAFTLLLAWFYGLAALWGGRIALDPPIGIVTVPPLGALGGLLVGTYDARSLERNRAVERLRRINETLRIATGELVEVADRDALERSVCERLADADSFTAAWVGRYDPKAGRVRPTAWAGFGDAVESLAITVDDGSDGDGRVWRRVIEGGETVTTTLPGDGDVGRWSAPFERRGVASATVVPIVGSDGVYGLVCTCADRPDAADDYHRDVLADLGRTVGRAIDSIRAHDELAVRERALLERNDRLDEFAGIVSHDLRNPLNVILGRAALMDGDGSDHLDAIERSAGRMTEIVDDLLALSRTNRAAVDLEPVSLAAVATESWQRAETDGVEFDVRVAESTSVRADPSHLRTVFENLVRNASDHNDPPLTVRVGLTAPATTDDGESPAGFYVADDGDGIPAADRERIFDHGYTTAVGGTGLGLSIVHRVVDAHGWRISCHEAASGGTRFEVTDVEFDG